MHHWTDHNIRVHTQTCLVALIIAHLVRRHADKAGLHLSVRGLPEQLAGIQETILIYASTGGHPKPSACSQKPTRPRIASPRSSTSNNGRRALRSYHHDAPKRRSTRQYSHQDRTSPEPRATTVRLSRCCRSSPTTSSRADRDHRKLVRLQRTDQTWLPPPSTQPASHPRPGRRHGPTARRAPSPPCSSADCWTPAKARSSPGHGGVGEQERHTNRGPASHTGATRHRRAGRPSSQALCLLPAPGPGAPLETADHRAVVPARAAASSPRMEGVGMRAGRIMVAIIGGLLTVVGFGALAGGAVLLAAHATQRDDSGFYQTSMQRLEHRPRHS